MGGKKRLSKEQEPDINYILHHFIQMIFCLIWIRSISVITFCFRISLKQEHLLKVKAFSRDVISTTDYHIFFYLSDMSQILPNVALLLA